MKIEIVMLVLIHVTTSLKIPHITGPSPAPVACPQSMCHGKADGNYGYPTDFHYFLQCSGGIAYCQACWPSTLEFSPRCNQCLYKHTNACQTTKRWEPATTYACPDQCPHDVGPNFSGNINDPKNKRQYVACWKGITVGCIACPNNLEFNQQWNACLYEGKYNTLPHF